MGMFGKLKKMLGFDDGERQDMGMTDAGLPEIPDSKTPPMPKVQQPRVEAGRIAIRVAPEFARWPDLAPLASPDTARALAAFISSPKVVAEARLVAALGEHAEKARKLPFAFGVPGFSARLVFNAQGGLNIARLSGDCGEAEFEWGYGEKEGSVEFRKGNLAVLVDSGGLLTIDAPEGLFKQEKGGELKKDAPLPKYEVGFGDFGGPSKRVSQARDWDRRVYQSPTGGYGSDDDSLLFMMAFPDLAVWRNPTSMRAWAVWWMHNHGEDEFRSGDTVVRMEDLGGGRARAYVETPDGHSQFECHRAGGDIVLDTPNGSLGMNDPAGECSFDYKGEDRSFEWSPDDGMRAVTPVSDSPMSGGADKWESPVAEESAAPEARQSAPPFEYEPARTEVETGAFESQQETGNVEEASVQSSSSDTETATMSNGY